MNKFYIIIVLLFLILQKAFPQSAFTYQGNLCLNTTISFNDASIVNASSWSWDFGNGEISTEQNPSMSYADTGLYSVKLSIIIESNGKSDSSIQKIYISDNPKVGFLIDSTQVYYSTYSRVFTDTSIIDNPINSYTWDFGNNSKLISTDSVSIMYKYTEKGSYEVWLKVTDSKGCVDSSSNTVNIHDRYYIPNVFTPNGDSMNDQFVVTSNGSTLFSIEIYSRWGNVVFKRSGHQQIVWDGRMPEGTMVTPGTYFYVISSESGDVTYEPEKGYITVLY